METLKLSNENEYHSTTHLKYLCRYHVIFCPKYRRKILTNGIDETLKQAFLNIAEQSSFSIIEMEIMPDHVHLLIDCNPRYDVLHCIHDLKWKSAHVLNEKYPALKSRLPSIWTRSSFIATVGSVSLETVKQYIKSQKGK